MNMSRLLLLSFLVAVGSAGSAFGQASATMSLQNIRYDLIDLDLGDGIAPSITMAPVDPYGYPLAWALVGDAAGQRHPEVSGASVLGAVSAGASYANPATVPATLLSAGSSMSGALPDAMALHSTAAGADPILGAGMCCSGWAASTRRLTLVLTPATDLDFPQTKHYLHLERANGATRSMEKTVTGTLRYDFVTYAAFRRAAVHIQGGKDRWDIGGRPRPVCGWNRTMRHAINWCRAKA